MSLLTEIREVAALLQDSAGTNYDADVFYGTSEWKIIDTRNQQNPFIYVDPIEGVARPGAANNWREEYDLRFLIGKCVNVDQSKEQEESIIWGIRPYALQFLRRLFEQTNDNGAKLYMPAESASLREVRQFLSTNIYGIFVQVTVVERFPSETC